jgi:hypothetical protein
MGFGLKKAVVMAVWLMAVNVWDLVIEVGSNI